MWLIVPISDIPIAADPIQVDPGFIDKDGMFFTHNISDMDCHRVLESLHACHGTTLSLFPLKDARCGTAIIPESSLSSPLILTLILWRTCRRI